MSTDDRLLDVLAVAPCPRRAPAAGRRCRACAHSGPLSVGAGPPARAAASPHAASVTWAAAAAVAAAAFLAGLVIADDMPRPVRAAAHAVGLPVDSNELVDAQAALDRLGRALAAGDTDAVRAEDATMVRLVKSLDDDERDRIEPVAHEVHLRAVQLLADQ